MSRRSVPPVILSPALFLLLFAGACQTHKAPLAKSAPAGGETFWLQAGGVRLKSKIYRSRSLTDHPVLAVVLHGDLLAPGSPPTYHYEFASRAASRIDNLVAAALLRPGYADDEGDRSGGNQGFRTGDNYTPEAVDAVAVAVRALQSRFHPSATLLVGHSDQR